MEIARASRAALLLAIIAAATVGCATPEESDAPVDVGTDKDRDGVPDEEQALTNETVGGTNESVDPSWPPAAPG